MLIAAQPTRGLDVGAIEFVHRRLIAERDEGRGVLLVSLELDEIFSLSDRILVMFEGQIVGEYPPDVSENTLGLAMTGVAPRGRRGMTEAGTFRPPRAARRRSRRSRRSEKKRFNAQGLIVSLITTVIAFLVGGLVVLATGHNPISTYQAIFNGTGLTWLIPGYGNRADAASNLQQTLLVTTPLILCGLAVAFAFRCGMFNIGGQGQYFVGSYVAVIVGSSWGSIAGPPHIVLCIVGAIARRRGLGRDRRAS